MAGRWPLSAVSGPAGPGAAAKPPRGAPSVQVVTPAHPPPGGAARRGPRKRRCLISGGGSFRASLSQGQAVFLATFLLVSLYQSILAHGVKLGLGRQGRLGVAPASGGRAFGPRPRAPQRGGSRPCGLQSLTRKLKGRLSFTPTGRPDRGLAAAAPPRDPPFGAYAAHPHAPGGAARRGLGTPVVSDFRQKLRPIFASHALIVSLETALQVSLSRSLLSSLGSKLGLQRQERTGVAPPGCGAALSGQGPEPLRVSALRASIADAHAERPALIHANRPARPRTGGGCAAA